MAVFYKIIRLFSTFRFCWSYFSLSQLEKYTSPNAGVKLLLEAIIRAVDKGTRRVTDKIYCDIYVQIPPRLAWISPELLSTGIHRIINTKGTFAYVMSYFYSLL